MRRPCAAPALAAGLLGLLVLGCSTEARHLAATQGRPNNPLLWQAENPTNDGGTLYLLGSVHMGTPAMRDLGKAVSHAYDQSDELVVEVDLTNLDPVQTAQLMATHGTLPEGLTLRQVLRPETWDLLTGYLAGRGLDVMLFESMEPWFIATMVAVMEFEDAGLSGRLGVDQALIDKADGEKPIVPLETFESQLSMLSSFDYEIQDLMLEDSLDKSGEMKVQSEMIVESWRLGDEAGLEKVLFENMGEEPGLEPLYQVLFFDRNERMAAQLVELSGDGTPRFVVLGAGHMVGDQGIPALLSAEGFEVKQIGGM